MRVCRTAGRIARKEGANPRMVLAAALMHDLVSYPKSHPRARDSSLESARLAARLLPKYGFSAEEVDEISDAIRDHSFSRGAIPGTATGKILQDADRLDAIGAIGIARTFSVGGSEGRPFYSTRDPFCRLRKPDDKVWTLDHFYKKLLRLESGMNTPSARLEAKRRTGVMRKFLDDLRREIQP